MYKKYVQCKFSLTEQQNPYILIRSQATKTDEFSFLSGNVHKK